MHSTAQFNSTNKSYLRFLSSFLTFCFLTFSLAFSLAGCSGGSSGSSEDPPVAGKAFKMVVQVGADLSFLINTSSDLTNYSVDCNDNGTMDATAQTGNYPCSYTEAGTYTISLTGSFPHLFWNTQTEDYGSEKIIDVSQWGTNKWTSTQYMFRNAKKLKKFSATDTPDFSSVTSMLQMFANAIVFNGDLSKWDTSKVTNMDSIFNNAYTFNGDISAWNVSSVNNMEDMFFNATAFNGNLSNWKTAKVINMMSVFKGATAFNQDISFNETNDAWNVSSAKYMTYMFQGATAFNGDISNWKTTSITDISLMFKDATAFDQDISSWTVGEKVGMMLMFNGATAFSPTNKDKIMCSDWWGDKPTDAGFDATITCP